MYFYKIRNFLMVYLLDIYCIVSARCLAAVYCDKRVKLIKSYLNHKILTG